MDRNRVRVIWKPGMHLTNICEIPILQCKYRVPIRNQEISVKEGEKEMFINFSNHPSSMWSEKQKTEAEKYGLIEDLPFPAVSAHADRKAVQDLAEHYVAMILEKQPECVMCQGEFCLSYHVIERLKKTGVRVVAACSERVVEEVYGKTGTEKKSVFQFIQFREY